MRPANLSILDLQSSILDPQYSSFYPILIVSWLRRPQLGCFASCGFSTSRERERAAALIPERRPNGVPFPCNAQIVD